MRPWIPFDVPMAWSAASAGAADGTVACSALFREIFLSILLGYLPSLTLLRRFFYDYRVPMDLVHCPWRTDFFFIHFVLDISRSYGFLFDLTGLQWISFKPVVHYVKLADSIRYLTKCLLITKGFSSSQILVDLHDYGWGDFLIAFSLILLQRIGYHSSSFHNHGLWLP